MATNWIINVTALAATVKNPDKASASLAKDYEAKIECPKCHHLIDNTDVSAEWPGLPAGVKFDPSDLQLLDHLAAKCGVGNSRPHELIDEFIPTIEGDQGICYTHPENLPGVKKDGSVVHFFHKNVYAYANGKRKRRRIENEPSPTTGLSRWHKTGKTKCVTENGVLKGRKKIMVLYKGSRESAPQKSNWVTHQYHLGPDEDEKQGDYVLSKIFYQQKNETEDVVHRKTEGPDSMTPETSITNPPSPHRASHDAADNDFSAIYTQKQEPTEDFAASTILPGNNQGCRAGNFQEAKNSNPNGKQDAEVKTVSHASCINNSIDALHDNSPYGISIADLENFELTTPELLGEFPFDSHNNFQDWFDHLQ